MKIDIVAKTLVFAAVITLCGCTHWVKRGASQAETDRAIAECRYESEANTNPSGNTISNMVDDGFRQARLFRLCMESKGFRQEPRQ